MPDHALLAPPAAHAAARTVMEEAYAVLRRDILAGILAPGTKLRSAMLRQRYGYGGGPLREALTRLAAEMLVTFQGQRGFTVAEVSRADFADLCETRRLIETEALRRAILAGDSDWEARVRAAFLPLAAIERQPQAQRARLYDEWERCNQAFHNALLSSCPSRWLVRLHLFLFQQAERYRRLAFAAGATASRDMLDEHRLIMEAALRRDVDAACGLAASHIRRTLGVLDREEALAWGPRPEETRAGENFENSVDLARPGPLAMTQAAAPADAARAAGPASSASRARIPRR